MITLDTEQIEKDLREKGRAVVYGFGAFEIRARRGGKINLPHGSQNARYDYRVVFIPSDSLKRKINS